MDQIEPVSNNETEIDSSNYISVFDLDPDRPTEYLFNTVSKQMSAAEETAIQIYHQLVKDTPTVLEAGKALNNNLRLVVSASEKTMDGIAKGTIKLVNENGNVYAQIKNGQHYGKKLPVRAEKFSSFDPSTFAAALQMQALQTEVESVHTQVMVLTDLTKGILQGQTDDRIGLYLSGAYMFIEAKSVKNKSLAVELCSQAIRSISEAEFQLSVSLNSDIKYIVKKEYKTIPIKERQKNVTERMNSIEQKYTYIHKATMLKSAIYFDLGETGAMVSSLREYSKFIDNVIVPNALVLSQVTVGDDGSSNGRWQKRIAVRLDVSDLANRLSNLPKTMYIGLEQDNNLLEGKTNDEKR